MKNNELKANENMSREAEEALKAMAEFEAQETPEQKPDQKPEESPVNLPAKKDDEKKSAEEARQQLKEFKKRSGIIKKQVGNIENSFLLIAFQLHWIKRTETYKNCEAKNIYDYAENEFGLGRTTCCNLICIVENFAMRDEAGNIVEQIEECYRNFKASQLVAMIGMTDEERKKITPEMSVRTINEMRKQAQKQLEQKTENEESDEESDEESGSQDGKSKKEPKRTIENVIIYFDNYQKYQHDLETMDALIERAFKKSTTPVRIKIVCEQEC